MTWSRILLVLALALVGCPVDDDDDSAVADDDATGDDDGKGEGGQTLTIDPFAAFTHELATPGSTPGRKGQ